MLWLPVLVGLLVLVLVVFFAWTIRNQQIADRQKQIESEVGKIAGYIDTDLRGRIASLQRYVKQWELSGGFSQVEFSAMMQDYINDMPGFQAIEWVDRDYFVRWIIPLAGNEKAQDLNLALEEKRRLALETAKNYGGPSITTPVDLVQGGKGFLIYFPIFQDKQFQGFILAVFRVETWLNFVLDSQESQETSEGLRVIVSMDDTPVFTQPGWETLTSANGEGLANIRLMSHRFTLLGRPTQIFLLRNNSLLPEMVGVIGFFLAGVMALMVFLFQKASAEAYQSETARKALEAEIDRHTKTSGELQDALSRLDMANKAGGIGVWSWDVSTDQLSWNERMYYLFDVPPDVPPLYSTWRQAVHPDDLAQTEQLLQNAVRGKAVFNTEFRIVLPSGALRYLGAAARVERDRDGKPLRVNGINWDLTDLKKAEQTLRKSEEQVRLLLNSTAEAIYGIDLDGRCTFANPACLKLLEYNLVSDLLGKQMHNLIHHTRADDSTYPVEACSIYQALRVGEQVHRDDEVLWKASGKSFPVEYWSFPQMVDGKVAGAVVTFIDITERKQSEQTLAMQRRRLSDILEGTNAGTWEWNVQTGETIFNERWANMLGYSLAEISPTTIDTWVKLTHPEDLQLSNELLQKHFSGELDYYECEARMRHKDEYWVWVLDRGKISAWTQDGKPLMMSGTHQDITARKNIENDLRQSESQNRALLSAIPDLIFRLRSDGTVLDFKASSEELLALPAERIVGSSIQDLMDSESLDQARLCILRAIESGQVQSMEYLQKIGDGVHTFEARFKSSGQEEVIAIIRDVSERARLERMKSDFINRATHELRTPIATMVLMVSLMDDETDKEAYEEYWRVMKGEINRERLLIEDLLSAGRLESDRFQFNFRKLDVAEVLKQVIIPLKISALDKGIEFEVEGIAEGSEPCLVNGDETALSQVFMNLLGNALKFTPARGAVRVCLERSNAGYIVSVKDTGIGIPADDLPMLFNRFFRGSNAVKDEIPGTGIGLYIVRSILDKHGAKIKVSSEVGKGSQFDVWLPRGDSA